VPVPHLELVREKIRSEFLDKFPDAGIEHAPLLSPYSVKGGEGFFAQIHPNRLLSRDAIDKIAPMISQILLSTSETGRKAFSLYLSHVRAYDAWQDAKKRYGDSESVSGARTYLEKMNRSFSRFANYYNKKFMAETRKKEDSIREQMIDSLNSIWLGNSANG